MIQTDSEQGYYKFVGRRMGESCEIDFTYYPDEQGHFKQCGVSLEPLNYTTSGVRGLCAFSHLDESMIFQASNYSLDGDSVKYCEFQCSLSDTWAPNMSGNSLEDADAQLFLFGLLNGQIKSKLQLQWDDNSVPSKN